MLAILDVLIGLIFIYGLFSVLVSAATELLLTVWSQRGKTLWMAVQGLLPADANEGKSNVVTEFLKHPLVQGLGAAEHDANAKSSSILEFLGNIWARIKSAPQREGVRASFPSYLPTHVFVDTVMHLLRSGSIRHGNESAQADVNDLINDVVSEPMRTTLQALHQSSQELGIPFRARLEHWFNDSMDRASGWYKRMSQIVMVLVAFILAVWCNVDTLRIIAVLSVNKDVRKSVADSAADYVATQLNRNNTFQGQQTPWPPPSLPAKATPSPAPGLTPVPPTSAAPAAAAAAALPSSEPATVEQKVDELNSTMMRINTLGLPIGWGKAESLYALAAWPLVLIGWMMSALAATLGANFWFQILGNLVKLRITGPKPKTANPSVASAITTATTTTSAMTSNFASLNQAQPLPAYSMTEPMQPEAPPAGYGLEPMPDDAAMA